ncbi:MAG: 6-phosphogluconolactonase [Pseudomonadota bacterium]
MERAFTLTEFGARETASNAMAVMLARTLADAIEAKGKASLMVSGGSTPGPAYKSLSHCELDWASVTIGLVDERWVPPCDPASNERLVRETLLQDRASAAAFLSMKTDDPVPSIAVAAVAARYATALDFDAITLGMGPDGHTASWFPGAKGAAEAMSPQNRQMVAAINADESEVAGEHALRITLTATAINTASVACLLLFGDDKRRVFEAAAAASFDETGFPVSQAITDLSDRLHVYWAP